MKLRRLLPLLVVASLTACSQYVYHQDTLFAFDTFINIKIKGHYGYSGQRTFGQVYNLAQEIDLVANAYGENKEVTNIFDINGTNEKIEISENLYKLLSCTLKAQKEIKYFNPMIRLLSDLWKKHLERNEVPSQEDINAELLKMKESSFTVETTNDEKFFVQRIGEGQIDVGAIAKGFMLDECLEYLTYYSMGDYLIDAGSSSILLGENSNNKNSKKAGEAGTYSVNIRALNKSIRCKNSFVSTSGITEQNTTIDGVTYSHIINPESGSAASLYDEVIVISKAVYGNGYLGDVLSTSFMMSSLDEIKEAETKFEVKAIVIKDSSILYQNEGIEIN